MTRIAQILGLVVVLGLTGCLSYEDEPVLGSDTLQIRTINGFSMSLLANAALDPTGLQTSEDGRTTLKYLAQCALVQGDSLDFTYNNVSYSFPGKLAAAPNWKTQALSTTEQYAVSGCMLAITNYYGAHVEVSLRRDGITDVEPGEDTDFPYNEATFYGNIFATGGAEMYACSGTQGTSVPDKAYRVCGDEDPQNPGYTYCGYVYTGACSVVCTTVNGGSYNDCYTNPYATGTQYSDATTAWLNSVSTL